MIYLIRDLLNQVWLDAGPQFSGLGLVVCDAPDELPIVSISSTEMVPSDINLAAYLAQISQVEHEQHDGFHILSSDLLLLKVAQYLLPPLDKKVVFDRSKRFGGRYIAALFGSALPAVKLTGIASGGFGIAVFKNGREVLYEAADA